MRGSPFRICFALLAAFVCASAVAAEGTAPAPLRRAQEAVDRAKAAAVDIPAQAIALTHLAWDPATADPLASALARDELAHFGNDGLAAMRAAVGWVPDVYKADLVATIIECRYVIRAGVPADYFPALEDVIWFGSADARRVAMLELEGQPFPPTLLPVIDIAFENPELTDVVLRTLGGYGDDRARYYLGDVLRHGTRREREIAAQSLSRIGGRALGLLRELALSSELDVRRVAMGSLLPLSGVEDLGVLHDYARLYPEDDPVLVGQIRQRALALEAILEQTAGSESDPLHH
ncbi:MAG TPA: hypothetical protein VJS92_15230 [Candidatus Polarisedimenticolaceae bacterium]|nr:hypothetical protein [Candidatus Polarisedimenticolaceae bacterium]